MPWVRLTVAEDAEDAAAVANLLREFAAAWEADGRQPTTALFARADAAGAWEFLAVGFKLPAVAEVMERFGFRPCPTPKPDRLRLLIGHPVAARVIQPHGRRSRRWWAGAREKSDNA